MTQNRPERARENSISHNSNEMELKIMAKKRRNLGGFSWKRLYGLTRAKQNLSRKTGIPLTKSGRQRKYGKAMGGCCVVLIAALTIGMFLSAVCYACLKG